MKSLTEFISKLYSKNIVRWRERKNGSGSFWKHKKDVRNLLVLLSGGDLARMLQSILTKNEKKQL